MPDDFEHNMAQRMDSFSLNPDPQVWDRVAAALPPEKERRRFVIWWWLLPLAICLGGGVWLMTHSQKNSAHDSGRKIGGNQFTSYDSSMPTAAIIPADTISDFAKQKLVSTKNTITVKQQVALQKNTIKKENDVVKKQYRKEVATQRFSTTYQQPAKKFSTGLSNSELSHFDNGGYKTTQPDTSSTLDNTEVVTKDSDKNVLLHSDREVAGQLFHDAFQMQRPVSIDSSIVYTKPNVLMLPSVSAIPPESIKLDSSAIKGADTLMIAANEKRKPLVKSKLHKARWNLVFAAGISSLNSNTTSNEKALYQSLYTGTFTGNVANQSRFANPESGAGFNIGINRQQFINKRWSWQAQISYQYLSSKQQIGSVNDSLLLSNGLSLNVLLANAYNTRVTTTGSLFTNRVHRLQLAPQIIYTINPLAQSPLGLSAGMAVAYNLSNHLLLHDYRYGAYIRSAQLSNNLMLGGIVAADVFINKKIHAGLIFEHDFTNVAKSAAGSVFHWNQLQIKLGIPLSK